MGADELITLLKECGAGSMPLRFSVRHPSAGELVDVPNVETVEVLTIDGQETINIELS